MCVDMCVEGYTHVSSHCEGMGYAHRCSHVAIRMPYVHACTPSCMCTCMSMHVYMSGEGRVGTADVVGEERRVGTADMVRGEERRWGAVCVWRAGLRVADEEREQRVVHHRSVRAEVLA